MKLEDRMLSHEINLSEYATLSKEAVRLEKQDEDIRPPYFRDIDRIIYSLAYTRYIDKTQVFSFKDNDHISKRIIHVQFVSKIAKTIGRALGLNEDLIEAMALGHDLGHVPFGHVGEAILNELSLKYDNTYFNHNVQSVRQLMNIENYGKGSNITVQALDGMLCHNGEILNRKYYPKKKTVEEFLNDYNNTYVDKNGCKKLIPMTLEGCVVRLSDVIAYIGRDIEDAMRLGVITIDELPIDIKNILGSTNRDIINTITLDIINNSNNKNYIEMSEKVFKAMNDLKTFNYTHIYNKANTVEQVEEYKKMFSSLFVVYLKALNEKDINNHIYSNFLIEMSETYKNNNSNARIVIDYIAGMTDDYIVREYKLYC